MTQLICPRCLGRNVGHTCLGVVGAAGMAPTLDPNKAECRECGHTGNVGDWWLVAELRTSLRPYAVAELRRAITKEAQVPGGASAIFAP